MHDAAQFVCTIILCNNYKLSRRIYGLIYRTNVAFSTTAHTRGIVAAASDKL